MWRQEAERALVEALGFDTERVVEAGPVILPGDGGCQLHQLAFIEMLLERPKQVVRQFNRRAGHCDGIAQDQFLERRELGGGLEFSESHQLFFGDSRASAHGRPDIDSEWASDHDRCLDAGQRLQPGVDRSHGLLAHFHLADCGEQPRLMSGDFERQNHAADLALSHPVQKPGEQSGLVGFDCTDARHGSPIRHFSESHAVT